MAAAPQAPMAAMDEGSAPYSEEAIRVANDAPPPAQVGLAPPPAYRPPIPDPRSPAGRAGGHALEFTSLHRETLRSGSGGRRIALFSESWPVEVERKLFPALAEDAFLVAELKSPGKSFLPAGEARLHVGDDPAGVAQLPLVAPGEAFTLPLGVDRALRPVRNVRVLTGERGLFGSDEVTGYEVTIELANPYPHPVKVRVLDQWPLSSQEKVEVALLRTEPYALQDATTGALEWRLTLPPGGKTTVSFAYSLRRPKGWRLHQNQ